MTLRRRIAAAALVLTAPALASCGFDPVTDRIYTPGEGVNDRSGSVDILGTLIVSGEDGSGTLVAGLVNNDEEQGDSLTGITGGNEASPLSISAPGPIDVPAGTIVQLADEGNVSVTGDSVASGAFIKLTFNFERSESVTLDVPVVADRGPYADVPLPTASPSAEPSEEPAAQ